MYLLANGPSILFCFLFPHPLPPLVLSLPLHAQTATWMVPRASSLCFRLSRPQGDAAAPNPADITANKLERVNLRPARPIRASSIRGRYAIAAVLSCRPPSSAPVGVTRAVARIDFSVGCGDQERRRQSPNSGDARVRGGELWSFGADHKRQKEMFPEGKQVKKRKKKKEQ